MGFPIFEGNLDRKKMSQQERHAYEAYCGAKARSKKASLPPPEMTVREFMGWWLFNLKSFTGETPSCGRINHSLGYRWDNIELQNMKDNSREGMIRNRTNINTGIKFGNKIIISSKETGDDIAIASSIRDAARIFSVSQRLIQFLIRGKYKSTKKINFNLRSAK